jgi:hypothetical protein
MLKNSAAGAQEGDGEQGATPVSMSSAFNASKEGNGMFIFFIGAKWDGEKGASDDNAVVFANFNRTLERFRNSGRRTPGGDSQVTTVPTESADPR